MLRRRRPHCRSLGPRHAAAKFPNKDSFGCFEMFRGAAGAPAVPAASGGDRSEGNGPGLRCSARLAPPLLPLPPPCLASSLPSPLLSPSLPSLSSAAPPLSTRYGDDGGSRTCRTLPARLLWPCVHSCSARRDRRGAPANHCLRRRNVAGGVTSRGSRAGGRKAVSGKGFWETFSLPRPLLPHTMWTVRMRHACSAGGGACWAAVWIS